MKRKDHDDMEENNSIFSFRTKRIKNFLKIPFDLIRASIFGMSSSMLLKDSPTTASVGENDDAAEEKAINNECVIPKEHIQAYKYDNKEPLLSPIKQITKRKKEFMKTNTANEHIIQLSNDTDAATDRRKLFMKFKRDYEELDKQSDKEFLEYINAISNREKDYFLDLYNEKPLYRNRLSNLDHIVRFKRPPEDALKKLIEKEKLNDELIKKMARKLPALPLNYDAVLAPYLDKHPSTVLFTRYSIEFSRQNLEKLLPTVWLNDEVINMYFSMIKHRSEGAGYLKVYAFSTFFYGLKKLGFDGVKKGTKRRKIDIFSFDLVILPVHLGMHWCCCVIEMKKKKLSYYDSLKGSNPSFIAAMKDYLVKEHYDKQQVELDLSDWEFTTPKNIPGQRNGYDCGVFTCQYAEYSSRAAEFTFTQEDMPYFRKKMIYEIVTGNFLV